MNTTVRNLWLSLLTIITLVITCISFVSLNKQEAYADTRIPMGGGSGIILPVKNDPFALGICTLGAIGKDNQGRLIGITAGHCGEPGVTFQAENFRNVGNIGKILVSNPVLDFAIVALDQAKVRPVKQVGNGVIINHIDSNGLVFPDTICKTGRTTGTNCGVVWEADRYTHTSSLCVLEGDSGGPVVKGTGLVGIVTAYYGGSLPIGCFPAPETGTNINTIISHWGHGFQLLW